MKVHAMRASAKSNNTTGISTCTHSANSQTDMVHIFGAKSLFPTGERRNVVIVLIKMTQNEKEPFPRRMESFPSIRISRRMPKRWDFVALLSQLRQKFTLPLQVERLAAREHA
jgi:hypothetical protein